jgi:protein-tyrosine phosphatase
MTKASPGCIHLDTSINPAEVTWITDRVAITNFVSAQSKQILAEHNVRGVLCLDRELEGGSSIDRGVECIRVIHLKDGANDLFVFKQAVSALVELADSCGRVVVHCRAGRSRSIAVVAAYLKKVLHAETDVALEIVRSKRQSAVAPELIRLVERFES